MHPRLCLKSQDGSENWTACFRQGSQAMAYSFIFRRLTDAAGSEQADLQPILTFETEPRMSPARYGRQAANLQWCKNLMRPV